MQNPFLNFIIKLIALLTIVFGIHTYLLSTQNLPIFNNYIIASYVINALIAIGIFGGIYALKNKYKESLGFLFIAGSFLKFIVFFLVFYPKYKSDGIVTKVEFFAFFIPYIIALILETYSLSKWLNKL